MVLRMSPHSMASKVTQVVVCLPLCRGHTDVTSVTRGLTGKLTPLYLVSHRAQLLPRPGLKYHRHPPCPAIFGKSCWALQPVASPQRSPHPRITLEAPPGEDNAWCPGAAGAKKVPGASIPPAPPLGPQAAGAEEAPVGKSGWTPLPTKHLSTTHSPFEQDHRIWGNNLGWGSGDLGSNPSSVMISLCDLKQVLNLPELWFPFLKNQQNTSS